MTLRPSLVGLAADNSVGSKACHRSSDGVSRLKKGRSLSLELTSTNPFEMHRFKWRTKQGQGWPDGSAKFRDRYGSRLRSRSALFEMNQP